MILINTQQDLDNICDMLKCEARISIDTEFERRHTYFAILSIIQITSNSHKFIIDALLDLDLTKFKEILLNHQILKIFHAPREDFEIFYHLFKTLPNNIFDTQIAASVSGLGKALSYSNLCHQICNVIVDKTYQKADWLKRPINQSMLQYAMLDVEYLDSIYLYLQNMITTQQLDDVYQNKLKMLLKSENYNINYDNAWTKVKFQERSEDFINKMKIIAAFRESCASMVNVPKKHFISDADLVKICRFLPTTIQELNKLQVDDRPLSKTKYKNKLLELCLGIRESNIKNPHS